MRVEEGEERIRKAVVEGRDPEVGQEPSKPSKKTSFTQDQQAKPVIL